MATSRLRLWACLFFLGLVCLLPSPTHAFGAGNIPSFSYLEGKAFRHGDIDDTITELVKKAGGLLGMGSKFTGLDVKRIYLGSFLADYSQAMDIGALEKLSKQSILNIVMVMGFMAFGYATKEFEITLERLGVYLPVEHIDNPRGYGAGKDARQLDPRLRGPVRDVEMEIDPRSGMKNYIANESGDWDTSSALVRRRLVQCIEIGRKARSANDETMLYEAYRRLGRCLHTLEDFPAHSNFCELALQRSGHRDVFCHVGNNVKVRTPEGNMVPPLVTGTFGGSDFIHSLLGEAQDHLSEASVSDLHRAVHEARSKGSSPIQDLLGLLHNVPGGSSGSLSRDAQSLNQGPIQDPATMDPQEIYRNLFRILSFRDSVMMTIERTMERIPGLNSLVEKISNSVSVFVFTLLEPYVQPIVRQALGGLQMSSAQVINNEDQFQVFNDPNASDPTHSMLSKDHFGLVLNEVAGNLALIIVRHCVPLVVKAWDNERLDATQIADECLACLFHPYWFNRNHCHPVQARMMDFVEEWGRTNGHEVRKLDRDHVRTHRNTRSGNAEPHSHGGSGQSSSYQYGVPVEGQQGVATGTSMAHQVQGYLGNKLSQAIGSHAQGPFVSQFRDAPGSTANENGNILRTTDHYDPSSGWQSAAQGGQSDGLSHYAPASNLPGPSSAYGQHDMPMPDPYSSPDAGFAPPPGPPPPAGWGPPQPYAPHSFGGHSQAPPPPPGTGYYYDRGL